MSDKKWEEIALFVLFEFATEDFILTIRWGEIATP